MKSEQWIENLAARARQETPPELAGSVSTSLQFRRRLELDAPRFPQAAMWISGAVSLMAACLLLTIGLHAQNSSAAVTEVQTTKSPNAVSVLFSPLDTESQTNSDSQ